MPTGHAGRVADIAGQVIELFHSSLCHLLQTEFPGVFGPAVTRLFADQIDALYERFHPPAHRVERFLAELRDVAKQIDPKGLVTYAPMTVPPPPSPTVRSARTRPSGATSGRMALAATPWRRHLE